MLSAYICAFLLLFTGYDCNWVPKEHQSTNYSINSCRFAREYNTDDVYTSLNKREELMNTISYWEGKFYVHDIGYNAVSGLTYDGHGIEFESGLKHDPKHPFSASSKESLHLNILTLALQGDKNALSFFTTTAEQDGMKHFGTKDVKQIILQTLQRKINSYKKFNEKYPGFGGFLPWFMVTDDGASLLWDWLDRVPSLDNGQLVWSMIACIQVLKDTDNYNLASQYEEHVELMKHSAWLIFYESEGRIRTVANIKNVTSSVERSNYESPFCNSPPCYLDDPYEGELMIFFFELYANTHTWSSSDKEAIWNYKREKLQSVDFVTPKGNITVERGWWFSSHEKWKYLNLPYRSVEINKRLFINGEKARTWYSYMNNIPGMFASVTSPTRTGSYDPGYLSACGIQSISFETVQHTDVVTPYGAYPVILASPQHGLSWYLTMLKGSRMQGPFGSTEASFTDGTGISPVVTWDSKVTTVVAMLGGVSDITEKVLRKQGKYERFYNLVNKEWSSKFTSIRGEDIPFALPSSQLPCKDPCDFSTCSK
ncbi:hypothetical protein AKO1_011119 [Acrasis kona]|uniref:Endo-beta-1,2-glucanase SGL domain-containing protein n=1 Tax=Acrasis kona TaxID=1008807 RepID=A0AAW2YZ02_9EUKA